MLLRKMYHVNYDGQIGIECSFKISALINVITSILLRLTSINLKVFGCEIPIIQAGIKTTSTTIKISGKC